MNSTSNTDIDPGLLVAPFQLNIYVGLVLYVVSNISCIGNLIVYRSTLFRGRACSIYLFWEAFDNLFYFNFVLVTRIIQKGFRIPVVNRYEVLCKLRQFASEYVHQVAFTLFTLATIDRILSTQRSNGFRRWSNHVSLAHKLVPACYLFWFIINCHRLILYNLSTGVCAGSPIMYKRFDQFFEAVMSGIVPPIVLSILAIALVRSIRSAMKRQATLTNQANNQPSRHRAILQQIDSQLSIMLTLQALTGIPSFIPYGVELLYTNISENWYKSPLRRAWEAAIVEAIHLLSYFFFGISFYVSIISSRGVRQAIMMSLGMKRNEVGSQLTAQTG